VTSIGGSGYVVSPLDGVNVWMSDLEGLAAYVEARQALKSRMPTISPAARPRRAGNLQFLELTANKVCKPTAN
jgi:hypothetical protein